MLRAGRVIRLSTVLTRLTTSAPQKAGQNPSTRKPSPRAPLTALVNHSIKPLMMKMNKPSVTRMRGNVRIFVVNPTNVFTTPKINATPKNGIQPPENVTPGTTRVATHSAAALMSRRTRKPILELSVYPQHRLADKEVTNHFFHI